VCAFHRFFTFQSPARIPNTKRQRHVKEGCSHCRDSCRDSCAPHATRHTVYAPSMRHLMTHQFINIFLSSHRAALTHTVTRPCFVALFCEARPVLTTTTHSADAGSSPRRRRYQITRYAHYMTSKFYGLSLAPGSRGAVPGSGVEGCALPYARGWRCLVDQVDRHGHTRRRHEHRGLDLGFISFMISFNSSTRLHSPPLSQSPSRDQGQHTVRHGA